MRLLKTRTCFERDTEAALLKSPEKESTIQKSTVPDEGSVGKDDFIFETPLIDE